MIEKLELVVSFVSKESQGSLLLQTPVGTFSLRMDSEAAKNEWVKAIEHAAQELASSDPLMESLVPIFSLSHLLIKRKKKLC